MKNLMPSHVRRALAGFYRNVARCFQVAAASPGPSPEVLAAASKAAADAYRATGAHSDWHAAPDPYARVRK